jgi:hypothetical protein
MNIKLGSLVFYDSGGEDCILSQSLRTLFHSSRTRGIHSCPLTADPQSKIEHRQIRRTWYRTWYRLVWLLGFAWLGLASPLGWE